ncbi:YbhB/YbcL family Raf kinase inhibitor-like protein [Nocardia sp. NPDC059240]|uniref:YbhB/YbcL family Raf kinase inhibitor-like protein n=1 Tax=Nocardia sp. NPDC059240 TaxID=3346786 RepID=UPI0036964FA2
MTAAIGRLLRPVRAGMGSTAWFHASVRDAPETMSITSPAFGDGAAIPRRHAGAGVGEDISPPLHWSGIPREAVELILIIEDPDAPLRRPVVHGLFTGIDPGSTGLPEGALDAGTLAAGLTAGLGSFRRRGYAGPRPVPGHGTHHYVFQLLAVDRPSGSTTTATVPTTLAAITGHVLARGKLTGIYERS